MKRLTLLLALLLPALSCGQTTIGASKTGIGTYGANAAAIVTIAVTPSSATINSGATQAITCTITGSATQTCTWATDGGSLTTAGPSTSTTLQGVGNGAATIHVTATSAADGTKTAQSTITVSAVTESVTPVTVSVTQGNTTVITGTVTGAADATTDWTLGTCVGGSITPANGTTTTFTAPGSGTPTCVVTGASHQDATKTGTSTITVSAAGAALFQPDFVSTAGGSACLTGNYGVAAFNTSGGSGGLSYLYLDRGVTHPGDVPTGAGCSSVCEYAIPSNCGPQNLSSFTPSGDNIWLRFHWNFPVGFVQPATFTNGDVASSSEAGITMTINAGTKTITNNSGNWANFNDGTFVGAWFQLSCTAVWNQTANKCAYVHIASVTATTIVWDDACNAAPSLGYGAASENGTCELAPSGTVGTVLVSEGPTTGVGYTYQQRTHTGAPHWFRLLTDASSPYATQFDPAFDSAGFYHMNFFVHKGSAGAAINNFVAHYENNRPFSGVKGPGAGDQCYEVHITRNTFTCDTNGLNPGTGSNGCFDGSVAFYINGTQAVRTSGNTEGNEMIFWQSSDNWHWVNMESNLSQGNGTYPAGHIQGSTNYAATSLWKISDTRSTGGSGDCI